MAHRGANDQINVTSQVYEFNPYEFGSWDPSLNHFIELDYVGTNLVNGKPYNSTGCVNGFSSVRRALHDCVGSQQADFAMLQLGFTIGTSSSLFNAIIQTANATLLGIDTDSSIIQGLIDGVLSNVGADLRDSEVSLAFISKSGRLTYPLRSGRSGDISKLLPGRQSKLPTQQ